MSQEPNTEPREADEVVTQTLAALERIRRRTASVRERVVKHIAETNTPAEKVCGRHGTKLEIDLDASTHQTHMNGDYRIVYTICHGCVDDEKLKQASEWLRRAGVPENLLHATFDNFKPRDEKEQKYLEGCRVFARKKKGFLILIGTKGGGKSHLAVAAMREMKCGRFLTQSLMLHKLRATYRDQNAEDVIERCKASKLLVIDDMGMSGGGKDEVPMLHEILSYRHGERLPTVLTSNAETLEAFKSLMGERMIDRFKESTFRVCIFTGRSMRREARQKYFGEV